MPGQIQEVYAELGQVLKHPEAFGLGSHLPRPAGRQVGVNSSDVVAGYEGAANAARRRS